MNKISRAALPAMLAVIPMSIVCATAAATTARPVPRPAAAPMPDRHMLSTEILPGVRYTSNMQDHSVMIQTGIGTLVTQGGQFQVKDAVGNTVAGSPAFADTPKAQAAIAPPAVPRSTPAHRAVPATTVPKPVGNAQADFDTAFGIFSNEVGVALSVGALGGGIVGAVGGCVVGGTVGAAILPVLFLATGPAGCLVGVGLGGTVGGLVGGVAVGVPVGIASGVKMYNSMHAAGHI